MPIEQSRPGMVLARSVPNPKQPQHTLLKGGFKLDGDTISRLRSLRVRTVWIKYPKLDFLDEVLDPELVRQQQELYGKLKDEFSQAQEFSFAKVKYGEYVERMGKLFQLVLNAKSPAAAFATELQTESDDLFVHGTTVAALSLLAGICLESYIAHERPQLPSRLATDLTQLGVGCLLHDLGKLGLSEQLQSFRMTAQDLGSPEWQGHTEAGSQMIRGGLDPTAAQVVLNHHQHFDGSGFPARKAALGSGEHGRALVGAEIHIFCRIATLADRFDNFRYLPDGTVAPAVVALKRMRNPGYSTWFDPIAYKAFLEAVPPFTPGDQVTLNNGQDVVVTEVNESDLYKPVVRPIDPQLAVEGHKPSAASTDSEDEPGDIDLLTRQDLHIASVGDFDVTPYLK